MSEPMTAEQARLIVADATIEIAHITSMLAEFIEKEDATGDVKYAARGVLQRVKVLSDVIYDCAGDGTDGPVSYAEACKTLGAVG